MKEIKRFDLLVGKTWEGKAIRFLLQNATDEECDAARNKYFDQLDRAGGGLSDAYCCCQFATGTKKIGDDLELDWLKPKQHRYKLQPGAAFDVIGVSLEGWRVRVMDTERTKDCAEGFVSMAVTRRGLDSEFFTTVPSQQYKDGDKWKSAY